MPEIFRELGFRFFFYSDDHLPIHVHVSKNGKDAKFNIINRIPKLVKSAGLKSKDLKLAQILIEDNVDKIISEWINYFG